MKSLRIAVVIAALLSGYLLNSFLERNNLLFYATGTAKSAYLGTTWLMSQNEVQRAIDRTLSIPEQVDFHDPAESLWKRFKVRTDSRAPFSFLRGHSYYVFARDSLIAVTFTFRDSTYRRLDSLSMLALCSQYGASTKWLSDSVSSYHTWSTPNAFVEYGARQSTNYRGGYWGSGGFWIVYTPYRAQMDTIRLRFWFL